MTINDAKDKMRAVLPVLDKLSAVIGADEDKVISVGTKRGGGETPKYMPQIMLDEAPLREVMKAFPEIAVSLVPMGDDSRFGYLEMEIDGVRVYTMVWRRSE